VTEERRIAVDCMRVAPAQYPDADIHHRRRHLCRKMLALVAVPDFEEPYTVLHVDCQQCSQAYNVCAGRRDHSRGQMMPYHLLGQNSVSALQMRVHLALERYCRGIVMSERPDIGCYGSAGDGYSVDTPYRPVRLRSGVSLPLAVVRSGGQLFTDSNDSTMTTACHLVRPHAKDGGWWTVWLL